MTLKLSPKSIFVILLTIALLVVFSVACNSSAEVGKKSVSETQNTGTDSIHEGDIIFQSSQSRQCEAVKKATHSPYSHCGIILRNKGKLMVYEAIGPVKWTDINEWIEHGEDGHYVIKRVKDTTLLTEDRLLKMRNAGEEFKGLPYDIYFGWSDDKIYCSELVWKIYKEATGTELGSLQQLKEFDLSDPSVQTIMAERYGDNVPWAEQVISPARIFDSPLLKTALEGNH